MRSAWNRDRDGSGCRTGRLVCQSLEVHSCCLRVSDTEMLEVWILMRQLLTTNQLGRKMCGEL